MRLFSLPLLVVLATASLPAQESPPATTAPLPPLEFRDPTAFPVDQPIPYTATTQAEIESVLERVLVYLERVTPVKIVDRDTREPVADLAALPAKVGFAPTPYLISSYEWGVTYVGMLRAAEATGDARYRAYAESHLLAIAAVAAKVSQEPLMPANSPRGQAPLRLQGLIAPHRLDDCGSMGNTFIVASRAGIAPDALRPWIDIALNWISTGQMRLADGTLARNRPLKNSIWLDDLYMSVPALARMGTLTGEVRYYDDAVRQVLQFSERLFMPELGLYRHGWVQDLETHPSFAWGRANGWALFAMAELLSELPETHPGRAAVLKQYRAHAAGLARVQGRDGRWHQLLDRADSYLETSGSAMFVYALARGVNRGWLDPLAYGPMILVGWNGIAEQINVRGQVGGVCVATSLAFEPVYYYQQPVNTYAAHGYGPVLLAGAEVIALRSGPGAQARIYTGPLHFAPPVAVN